eukprot:TRINITY_DN25028_c0_g1_i1.p1 TRINITY_DN25028_c0_g1~~TRINITY_DN25028_c0_g1_i1.p1  ORF type:complete len:305 (-),score=56.33 TRINITY_DN25028_c0_g1_i1:20-892(-)
MKRKRARVQSGASDPDVGLDAPPSRREVPEAVVVDPSVRAVPAPRPSKGATTKRQRRAAKLAANAAGTAAAPPGLGSSDDAPAEVVRRKAKKKARKSAEAEELEREAAEPPRRLRSEDHFGPPVGVKTMVNDEWQTCRSAWEAMVPILGPKYRTKRVWQPFFYDGECGKHLQSLGFEHVTHSREDFFEKVKDKKFMATVDFIWDNPPYTNQPIKERVLRACVESGKPFCLLLPLSILHAQFARDLLDCSQVQSVIPRKVYVKKRNQEPLPFKYLVWLCYKTGLDRDLYFL